MLRKIDHVQAICIPYGSYVSGVIWGIEELRVMSLNTLVRFRGFSTQYGEKMSGCVMNSNSFNFE